MGQMFMSELSALKEVSKATVLSIQLKELTISNLYIQDLYRFFKPLPQEDLEDPLHGHSTSIIVSFTSACPTRTLYEVGRILV